MKRLLISSCFIWMLLPLFWFSGCQTGSTAASPSLSAPEKVTGTALAGLNGTTDTQSDERTLALRQLIKEFVDNKEIVGASLLLAQHGRVQFREGFGLADLHSGKPFTVDTGVLIASSTKPISATCVMMLVEEGRISLDDKVSKYLPAFDHLELEGKGGPVESPTIRQLLSHTSGLYGLKGATKTGMKAVRDLTLSLTESVAIIAGEKLTAIPGSEFNYGGANFQVAARIVEIVSGQPFDLFMQQRLLNPLELRETYFKPPPERDFSGTATVYMAHPLKGLIPLRIFAPDPQRKLVLASGGLYSSLNDLAVFLQMHLNDGSYQGTRILNESSIAEMQKKQTGTLKTAYGLGWFINKVDSSGRSVSVSHPGLFGALIWMDRERDLVGVFLTTSIWDGHLEFRKQLMAKVAELFPVRT
ncbi:beta-lactamase family protein [bacterium]|nr:beta-lactamase family protein [bacterium]